MTGQTHGGAGWRELRQERGLTQQDVADALCRLARVHEQRGVGVNADMVSKWERGEKQPSAIYGRLLALLFDAAVTTASAAHAGGGTDLNIIQSVEDRLCSYDPLLHSALVDMWRDEVVKRRSMLKLMGALPLSGVDGVADSVLLRSANHPVAATAETATRLDELARDYQVLYHSAEPTELITPVLAYVRTVAQFLTQPVEGELRKKLLSAYGSVALLAGRLCFFDLHDAAAARGHFSVAMDAARELGDRVLAAAALGHTSFVPAAERNYAATRDYLRRTRSHAERGETSMVTSWASAVESELLSQAGDRAAALTALEHASTAAESASATLPHWFDFYDQGRLEGFRAFALIHAGRLDEARVAVERGLAELPREAVKQRSVLLADLATVHLRLDDVGHACRVAGAAVQELEVAGYATGADRLRQFRADVEPWKQHRAVRQLDERLAAL